MHETRYINVTPDSSSESEPGERTSEQEYSQIIQDEEQEPRTSLNRQELERSIRKFNESIARREILKINPRAISLTPSIKGLENPSLVVLQ